MTCPHCHQDVNPITRKFTWWGGALGPRLLSHVECPRCHKGFSGKTGRPNTEWIVLYCVVVGLVFGALTFYVLTS